MDGVVSFSHACVKASDGYLCLTLEDLTGGLGDVSLPVSLSVYSGPKIPCFATQSVLLEYVSV